jgi:hypothetical protein
MATGENLFSMQDARNLIRYGGMRADRDWLQFDCALSYGLVEYLRTLDMLHQHGWSRSRCIPHGGHQMSLNIAAGLGLGGNESYPDLFQPFGGFPDGVKVENGYITMPDLVGIGFEGKAESLQRDARSARSRARRCAARSAAGCRTGPPLPGCSPSPRRGCRAAQTSNPSPAVRGHRAAMSSTGSSSAAPGRGVAVVLTEVQHEIAPRHLQVQGAVGAEAVLPSPG